MKTILIFICLSASVGLMKLWTVMHQKVGPSWVIGSGLAMFSALVIYTVKNAQTKNQWSFQLSQEAKRQVKDLMEFGVVLVIITATVVILTALAVTGQDGLLRTVKSLGGVFDV